MTIWGWMTTIIGITFLSTCLVRIVQYTRRHGLFSNPCTARLLIMGFFTGLSYLLANYEIQRILESYNTLLPLPITPLLWLISGVLMATYIYIITVRKCTIFDVAEWVTHFLAIGVVGGIVMGVVLHDRIPMYSLKAKVNRYDCQVQHPIQVALVVEQPITVYPEVMSTSGVSLLMNRYRISCQTFR
jgi:hypothetical protein